MRAGLFWIALGVAILVSAYFAPYDDTDMPPNRSGVTTVVDAFTGCQYLRTPVFGAITPRMGRDGKQICTKAPQ